MSPDSSLWKGPGKNFNSSKNGSPFVSRFPSSSLYVFFLSNSRLYSIHYIFACIVRFYFSRSIRISCRTSIDARRFQYADSLYNFQDIKNYYNIKCKCYENRFISVIIKAYEWTFARSSHSLMILYNYIPYHFAYHQITLFIVYCCKKKKYPQLLKINTKWNRLMSTEMSSSACFNFP